MMFEYVSLSKWRAKNDKNSKGNGAQKHKVNNDDPRNSDAGLQTSSLRKAYGISISRVIRTTLAAFQRLAINDSWAKHTRP